MRLTQLALFLCLSTAVFGQELATLSGVVVDPSGGAVADAALKLRDLRRGSERKTASTETGLFVFDSLEPGDYALEVAKAGFSVLKIDPLHLKVRDRQSLRLEMAVGAITTSVDVTDELESLSTDPSFGATIDQSATAVLPISGRSVESLMLMAPGIISANGGRGGFGIHSNGMRANTNYFTVDGLSLNISMGEGGGPLPGGGLGLRLGGAALGAAMPGMINGSLTGTVSLDSMQEVRVQTSTFAPEFGRTPGAQVAMTSRSGNNRLSGSVYEYFGNDRLNANEYFANSTGRPRAAMRLNQFGATLGGPIWRTRSFFFAAFEGVRAREADTAIVAVPNHAIRARVAPALRPYLNAFPKPNGAALEGDAAEFQAVFSNPSSRNTGSLRLDHAISAKHSLFARALIAPGWNTSRGSELVAPNVVNRRDARSTSYSAGLVSALNPSTTNDLRVNYSLSRSVAAAYMDTFGGAVPLTAAQMFPAGVKPQDASFALNILGLSSYQQSGGTRNDQRQVNVVEGVTMTAGTHQYKLGGDFRVLMPTQYNKAYSQSVMFAGLSGSDDGYFTTGMPNSAVVSAALPAVKPLTVNTSVYIQDTAKISRDNTITYGMRWDVNPAPTVRSGPRPLVLCDDKLGGCGLTQQLPMYDTRWADLAPRLGFTSLLSDKPGAELVFRAGLGVFHDMGYGNTPGAFNGAPYFSTTTLVLPLFPLSSTDMAQPKLPPVSPFGMIAAADRQLRSPTSFQYNLTLERSLGRFQVLSASYVVNKGRNLLRTQLARTASVSTTSSGSTTLADLKVTYDLLNLATNDADSDYHGMQIQFRRRLAKGFQSQVSYTWSHSIDTASSDTGAGGFATLFTNQRGNSDFDIRHNLSATGSYRLPVLNTPGVKAIFSDWWTDFVLSARTGLPLDVQGTSETTSTSSTSSTTPATRGLFSMIRPDYNGLPVWIQDKAAPAGQRLNKAAFTAPTDYRQGNLGRNSIRGFAMTQLDFSLRRQVQIREGMRVNIMAQAFNIFNHPNFANPSPMEGANLASPNFGVATRTLGSFGRMGGSTFARTGGPRSVQFALRFQF